MPETTPFESRRFRFTDVAKLEETIEPSRLYVKITLFVGAASQLPAQKSQQKHVGHHIETS